MIFRETPLAGLWVLELEKREDERGMFARTFCRREFEARGLPGIMVQTNISCSKLRGTLRGMHYQAAPFEETKLIRCTRGAIYDVVIDLRPDSATYLQSAAFELSRENYRLVCVPAGFAHGFQTLTDDAEVMYQVSQFYSPEHERGVRYNDPVLEIQWPLPVRCISAKDRSWPDLVVEPNPLPGRSRP